MAPLDQVDHFITTPYYRPPFSAAAAGEHPRRPGGPSTPQVICMCCDSRLVPGARCVTVWNGLAQGCLRLSMENGRVLAPFLYAWVSEDECAPDLRGLQSRPRPTAIPPAIECRSATRFTPRLRAACQSGDDARPPPLHPDVTHMRRVSPLRVSLYSIVGCELRKARSAPAPSTSTHAVLRPSAGQRTTHNAKSERHHEGPYKRCRSGPGH